MTKTIDKKTKRIGQTLMFVTLLTTILLTPLLATAQGRGDPYAGPAHDFRYGREVGWVVIGGKWVYVVGPRWDVTGRFCTAYYPMIVNVWAWRWRGGWSLVTRQALQMNCQ